MTRLYLGNEASQYTKGQRYINARLPRGMASRRWPRRMVTLTIRHFILNVNNNKPDLIKSIEAILRGEDGGTFVAPDGRYYREGQLAYWVPQHGHPPMGVCPICLELEQRYSQGGKPQQMYAEMMSPDHIMIHIDSAVQLPVCYCQIMPFEEANKYSATITKPNNVDQNLWAKIVRVVREYSVDQWGKAQRFALDTVNLEMKKEEATGSSQVRGTTNTGV